MRIEFIVGECMYSFIKKHYFSLLVIIFSVSAAAIYAIDFYPYITADSGDTFDHLNNVRRLLEEGRIPIARRSYPLFFYVIAGLVLIFKNYTVATLVYTCIFSFVANALQIIGIKKIYKTSDWYAALAGTSLSFIWPISFKVFNSESSVTSTMLGVYLTSGSTAPYHNLTYLCAKPFAVLSIILFILILKSDKKYDIRLAVLLGLSMLLSVLAKPCFYQCFAPAGTIYTIGYFFSKKCKELVRCITIALAFIPGTIWVLLSMKYNVSPLAFSPFESVMLYNSNGDNVAVIILRAIVYSIFVLMALLILEEKKYLTYYSFGALIYACGLLEWLLLIFYEYKWTLDTMWGYNMSMYILFMVSAGVAYCFKNRNKVVYFIGNVLLAVHSLIGVLVFLHL